MQEKGVGVCILCCSLFSNIGWRRFFVHDVLGVSAWALWMVYKVLHDAKCGSGL